MRMKKEIQQLEKMSENIEFPKPPPGFSRFRDELYAVINENCGYPIAKTLEYYEYEEKFYVVCEGAGKPFTLRERVNPLDDFNMSLTRVVDINPREPLLPQIERINEVQNHLRLTHNQLVALLELHRKGDITRNDTAAGL